MKTIATIRKAVLYGVAILLPWLVLASGTAAQEVFLLSDDATGGDCTTRGTWDPATKTCVLTSDLAAPVVILSSEITLDGSGHRLGGPGYGDAIALNGLTDIVVRNLVIEGFSNGIVMYEVQGALIDGNTVRGAGLGIWVNVRSSLNMFIRNTLEDNSVGLTITWGSHSNVIESNIFSGNSIGVSLGFTHSNEFVNNVLLDNQTQLTSRGYYNIVEANYWSDYDTPDEGCLDENGDGFCDAPRLLPGESDLLPGVEEDIDTAPPMVYVEATPSVLANDQKYVDVLVTGYAVDSKSGVTTLVIKLEDEYGVYDQFIPTFGTMVRLRGKTNPKDYDGRTYVITATAVDARGNEASSTATVVVPISGK